MKIAYVTTYDATDVNNWSGSGYFMARCLKQQSFAVDHLGPFTPPPIAWPMLKLKSLLYNRLLGKGYFYNDDIRIARHYARNAAARLSSVDADLVFSPGTIPVAFLDQPLPIFIWSDATHAAILNFYAEYSNLCHETIRDGHRIEKAALDRVTAAIFSSEWAALSAVRDYGMDPQKVHVVPYGANLEEEPTEAEVAAAIAARSPRRCKLLFMGVDWTRKGGNLALEIAAELNRRGLPTDLTVAGCDPFTKSPKPPYVRCEGFISKRTRAGRLRISQLLSESHFLIVPSVAECFGLVYCEASACGVPSLARHVGGVPTIIKDGVNGYLFPPEDGAEPYVRAIQSCFADYPKYHQMANASAHRFRTDLNWDVAGRRVAEIIRQHVPARAEPREAAVNTRFQVKSGNPLHA